MQAACKLGIVTPVVAGGMSIYGGAFREEGGALRLEHVRSHTLALSPFRSAFIVCSLSLVLKPFNKLVNSLLRCLPLACYDLDRHVSALLLNLGKLSRLYLSSSQLVIATSARLCPSSISQKSQLSSPPSSRHLQVVLSYCAVRQS